jgi:arylsulfatase A-like enzyme
MNVALPNPLRLLKYRALQGLVTFAVILMGSVSLISAERLERPNILWIVVEDMSPHFGCYGEKSIQTPHVDRLAKEGLLFERAFVTGPICSIARSALITGMYQTSIGAHHHRSSVPNAEIHLPASVKPLPVLFQAAGYFTANGSHDIPGKGKTDYNFVYEGRIYDGTDWKERKPGQPFFAQVQLNGGKVRDSQKGIAAARAKLGNATPATELILPPYYPATPGVLEDWAATLDAVRLVDLQVGEILERLKQEGILEQTVIFFITDHGVSHGRGKQFLYDEGTRIPCIIRGPGIPVGKRRADLIEHIDLAAMSLALARITQPTWMQAQNPLSPTYQPRQYTFSARDRADETVDRMRSVRSHDWKYIRNYFPQRPYLQPNHYKDNKPCLQALREAKAEGKLNEIQQLIFAESRAPEELYDLKNDPWETRNLAAEPARVAELNVMRSQLEQWMRQTDDLGRVPESAAHYDANMAQFLKGFEKKAGVKKEIEANITQMKRWASEGK